MRQRARALVEHRDSGVQASACGVLAIAGTAEDLERLAALKESSSSEKVRRSAKGAYNLLKRRLPLAYSVGQRVEGTVVQVSPRLDYVLLMLAEGFRSMLHRANMSEDFRGRLERGEIDLGMAIMAEVVEVDAEKQRVLLRNV